MRIAILVGLAALAISTGDNGVKTIDIKGLKLANDEGAFNAKPMVIANADELAKAISDQETRAKIAAQVDFTKEKLVYFKWSGSGGDKVSFTTAKAANSVDVTVTYQGGLTRDLRPHHYLLVMPTNAKWTVSTKK
ncbi:MAG TPA: hypothetical protein VE988_26025 [Gemmataceae bacterium]|nr:hypothetical protein [Gemmataceae bacterium]